MRVLEVVLKRLLRLGLSHHERVDGLNAVDRSGEIERLALPFDDDRAHEVALVLVDLDAVVLVGDLPVAGVDLIRMERTLAERDDPESEVSILLKTRRVWRLKEEYGNEPMIWYVG